MSLLEMNKTMAIPLVKTVSVLAAHCPNLEAYLY
jgi:hypothetical protein